MTPEEVERHFHDTGALLTGHFRLSSGLHSDRYLQCAKVLQHPRRADQLGRALGEKLRDFSPGVILSPAMGGILIGHEVGQVLDVRAVFAERTDGVFTLRRGFHLDRGERVVVVEDVITTGKSTREVLEVVKQYGAVPVACAAIVDRRPEESRREEIQISGVPVVALLTLLVTTWTPEACPLCKMGQTVVAPGSRFLNQG